MARPRPRPAARPDRLLPEGPGIRPAADATAHPFADPQPGRPPSRRSRQLGTRIEDDLYDRFARACRELGHSQTVLLSRILDEGLHNRGY